VTVACVVEGAVDGPGATAAAVAVARVAGGTATEVDVAVAGTVGSGVDVEVSDCSVAGATATDGWPQDASARTETSPTVADLTRTIVRRPAPDPWAINCSTSAGRVPVPGSCVEPAESPVP
jgi:hypothetical protein